MLRKLFSGRATAAPRTVPDGRRLYAIGDVHGRLDLLDALIDRIDADSAARGEAAVSLILLGDLVDRGPDPAGVVERVRTLAADRPGTRVLMGNHEEIFLAALGGDEKALRLFCRVGGRETALSYGMSADEYEAADYPSLAARLPEIVPETHRDFLAGTEAMVIEGNYVFVHAGLRPGVPLEAQRPEDLRWIRSSFLDHRGGFGRCVVHGHTILEAVELGPDRIGIDTGAYATGRLTALGLEGAEQWILQT